MGSVSLGQGSPLQGLLAVLAAAAQQRQQNQDQTLAMMTRGFQPKTPAPAEGFFQRLFTPGQDLGPQDYEMAPWNPAKMQEDRQARQDRYLEGTARLRPIETEKQLLDSLQQEAIKQGDLDILRQVQEQYRQVRQKEDAVIQQYFSGDEETPAGASSAAPAASPVTPKTLPGMPAPTAADGTAGSVAPTPAPTSPLEKLAQGRADEEARKVFGALVPSLLEVASKSGLSGAMKLAELRLGKQLTAQQMSDLAALTSGISSQDDLESKYRYLQRLSPDQRYEMFYKGISQDDRSNLIGKYGDTLEIPAAKDPEMVRQGIALGPVKVALDTLKGYVESPDYKWTQGPVMGFIGEHNAYDEKAGKFNTATKITAELIGKYLSSGRAVTDADMERYLTIMPNIRRSPAVNQAQLGVVSKLVDQVSKLYATAGIRLADGTWDIKGLPFTIGDASLAEIAQFLKDNPNYEFGQELKAIYELKKQAGLRGLNEIPPSTETPEATNGPAQ